MNTKEKIEKYVQKYAEKYGYNFPEMIVCQAILESGINGSGLSNKYNNFFGMKASKDWRGKSVNLNTAEYYNGYVNITAGFRMYDTVEDGIIGYFEFLKYPRYANLKDVKTPQEYAQKIKEDGWATSPTYTQKLIDIYNKYYGENAQKTPDKTQVKEAIKQLQTALNNYGGYGLVVDGIIGPKTLQAINKYNGG